MTGKAAGSRVLGATGCTLSRETHRPWEHGCQSGLLESLSANPKADPGRAAPKRRRFELGGALRRLFLCAQLGRSDSPCWPRR